MMAVDSGKAVLLQHLADFLEAMGIEEYCEEGGICRYISGIPFFLHNGTFTPGFITSPIDASHLVALKERGLPFCCWLQASVDATSLLEAGLVNPGPFTGAVRELEGDLEPKSLPPNVRIERVASPELYAEWASLSATNFSLPEACLDGWTRINRIGPLTHFVGFLDDKPVGTISLFESNSIAGLCNGAVASNAQRQGVATAMAQVALEEGQKRGCRSAATVLMADKQALRLCERFGFDLVCEVTPYFFQDS